MKGFDFETVNLPFEGDSEKGLSLGFLAQSGEGGFGLRVWSFAPPRPTLPAATVAMISLSLSLSLSLDIIIIIYFIFFNFW